MGAACCTDGDGKLGCCRRAAAADEASDAAALIVQEDACGGKGDDLEDLRREAARVDSQRAADAAAGPPSAAEGVRQALAAAEARALAAKAGAGQALDAAMHLGPADILPPNIAVPLAAAEARVASAGQAVAAAMHLGSSTEDDASRAEQKKKTAPSAMQFEVSWDGKGYVGKPEKGGGGAANGSDQNGMTGIEEGSSEEEDEPYEKPASANMPNTSSLLTQAGGTGNEFDVVNDALAEATPEADAKPVKKKRSFFNFSFRRKSAK